MSKTGLLEQMEQHIIYIRTRTNMAGLPDVTGINFQKLAGYMQETGRLMTDIPFVAYPGL